MSDQTPPAGTPDPGEPVPPPTPPPGPASGLPSGQEPPAAAPPPPPPPPPGGYPPPPPGYGTPAAAGPAGGTAFSVGDAFSWGWKKFQENLGPILIAVLVYFVILVVVEVIWYVIFSSLLISSPSIDINQETGAITTNAGSGFFAAFFVQALASFAFFVLFAFLQAAVIRGALMIADGKKLEVGDMFKFDQLGVVLLAAIIVAALTAVGYLFCFVGSLVVAFFTAFYLFFVIDKKLPAWESVKASFNLVKANAGDVLLLLLGVIAAYIVGAILCGIGLLVTAPVALLALTFGYRRLQNEPIAA